MPYKSIEISNATQVSEPSSKKFQFYKGYSSVNPANPTSKLFDLDLIKQNIINTFNTRLGERVMNPTFGSIIWDAIMEPMTPALRDALNKDIHRICNSDPRAVATQIRLTEVQSGYIIEVTMKLKGSDVSSDMILNFDQTIGLTVQ